MLGWLIVGGIVFGSLGGWKIVELGGKAFAWFKKRKDDEQTLQLAGKKDGREDAKEKREQAEHVIEMLEKRVAMQTEEHAKELARRDEYVKELEAELTRKEELAQSIETQLGSMRKELERIQAIGEHGQGLIDAVTKTMPKLTELLSERTNDYQSAVTEHNIDSACALLAGAVTNALFREYAKYRKTVLAQSKSLEERLTYTAMVDSVGIDLLLALGEIIEFTARESVSRRSPELIKLVTDAKRNGFELARLLLTEHVQGDVFEASIGDRTLREIAIARMEQEPIDPERYPALVKALQAKAESENQKSTSALKEYIKQLPAKPPPKDDNS